MDEICLSFDLSVDLALPFLSEHIAIQPRYALKSKAASWLVNRLYAVWDKVARNSASNDLIPRKQRPFCPWGLG